MKFFTAIFASGLLAVAAAQSSSSASSASSMMSGSSTSTALTPTETCLQNCAAGDVNCQAACEGIPYPNPSQINETTSCAANCNQGNGSPADTASYAACQQSCISSYFLTNTAGAANTASGSSGPGMATTTGSGSMSGSATGNSGSSSGSKPTGSAGASSSGGASSSSSGNAAALVTAAPAALALLAGVLAL